MFTGGAGIKFRCTATAMPDAATVALNSAAVVAALNERCHVMPRRHVTAAVGAAATAFQVIPREATNPPRVVAASERGRVVCPQFFDAGPLRADGT
jgi:hypothetical protein